MTFLFIYLLLCGIGFPVCLYLLVKSKRKYNELSVEADELQQQIDELTKVIAEKESKK